VRLTKEDDVDNSGLAIREIRRDRARLVVAMLVSFRMLGTRVLRERNLVHAHDSLPDGSSAEEGCLSASPTCARVDRS
jgi:hypothetical protein